jgi:hypothetical protein
MDNQATWSLGVRPTADRDLFLDILTLVKGEPTPTVGKERRDHDGSTIGTASPKDWNPRNEAQAFIIGTA